MKLLSLSDAKIVNSNLKAIKGLENVAKANRYVPK